MKVLQINSVCGIGSTGRIATDLYNVLKDNGHECKIAYGRGNPQNISLTDCIKIGHNFDIYPHAFLSRITDKTAFYSKHATKKLIEQIKQYNPDIIHLHNLHGYYINIEILFNYLSEYNKKVVWTLHDCWAFTGHCPHFDLVNCNKWETGCFNCPRKSDYPASYIVDNSKNNYEKKKKLFTSIKNMTIITPSEWLANLVQKSYLGKYSINVINNGIDLSAFKPTESSFKTEYNIQNKKIILGVASRWGVHKGLNDFIKLSSMLDDNYKIVLVGLSKKQIKLMPENIICISKTDSIKQLAQIYTAADIFVNLTYEDNYPTVNLEALACGTPVITYQTGGSVECINDACGMSVKKGDLDSALNAIKHICQDPRSIIKDSCIINAKKYDKKETYNKYINLYKNRI